MDRMSRFRRRPKPPTIETAVDRLNPEPVIINSPTSAISAVSAVSTASPDSRVESPVQGQSSNGRSSSKKPIFRSLRLKASSGKRPRNGSPASLRGSPVTVAVGQDGLTLHSPGPASPAVDEAPKPRIPLFLTLSLQEIEGKFHDILWAERHRVLEGQRHDAPSDFKWGTYKQSDKDAAVRGTMDRYISIKPWNHNRVRLKVPQDDLAYVNASTVTLSSMFDESKPPLRYIAMQGPTVPSFNYVWRMIAEQVESPAVIVQLTTMVEGGMVKCHQYFPSDGDEDQEWTLNTDDIWEDGWKAHLSLESTEEVSGGAIEKRKLHLAVEGEDKPRVVWHLLYRRWPDFGVPTLDDLDSFFELMKLSRDCSNPSSPRIIHCSAGVGRTGTFICLEHLMRELDTGALENYDRDGEQPDLVFETVDLLRRQRRSMVQAEIQYQFVYQVMRKLWMDKYGLSAEEQSTGEPAAKRLEVVEPDFESGPGPDLARPDDD